MNAIPMVDLKGQYERHKAEIEDALLSCAREGEFIKGPLVSAFEEDLANYLGAKYVIGCANGTDALQIAFMALGLGPGDEVIVPAFTYVATAEAAALLGIRPVMIDVCENTFNVTAELIDAAITRKTKAVVPVHLFGQSCDMAPIMDLARSKGLFVIEDTAQALGSKGFDRDKIAREAGTFGDIGCTSFFPSKNLGCFGDGGALITNNQELAERVRMTANHGQSRKYYHTSIGVNSRLDSIQAAVLRVKLKYLDDYCAAREAAACVYDEAFAGIGDLQTPIRSEASTHVFHQYTVKVANGDRDSLRRTLANNGTASAVYYPVPLYKQPAFMNFCESGFSLPVTEMLCKSVLSLPMHTELEGPTQTRIIDATRSFFNAKG